MLSNGRPLVLSMRGASAPNLWLSNGAIHTDQMFRKRCMRRSLWLVEPGCVWVVDGDRAEGAMIGKLYYRPIVIGENLPLLCNANHVVERPFAFLFKLTITA